MLHKYMGPRVHPSIVWPLTPFPLMAPNKYACERNKTMQMAERGGQHETAGMIGGESPAMPKKASASRRLGAILRRTANLRSYRCRNRAWSTTVYSSTPGLEIVVFGMYYYMKYRM